MIVFGKSDSVFSPWSKSEIYKDGNVFVNIMHSYVYEKALLVNSEMCESIMRHHSQRKLIQACRELKFYENEEWESNKEYILLKSILYKFDTDDIRDQLLNTGDEELVYSDYLDLEWGTGFRRNDNRNYDKLAWRGQNFYGNCLMQVRRVLRD